MIVKRTHHPWHSVQCITTDDVLDQYHIVHSIHEVQNNLWIQGQSKPALQII